MALIRRDGRKRSGAAIAAGYDEFAGERRQQNEEDPPGR
jgi:hypothetical protein